MPTLDVNGISVYYERQGSGEPVLFISGTGADLRVKPNVLDSPLAKQFSVLAFDQRGLGQTDKPDEPYSMEMYADDAAEVIVQSSLGSGAEPVHVVGVSFGGMVALHLALRHPQLVKRLVLCCTAPSGNFPSYPFHELPAGLSAEERLLKLMPVNDTRRDGQWQRANPEILQSILAYTRDNGIEEHNTDAFKKGAERQLQARADHDVESRLNEIKAPTLICAGKFDGIAPEANQLALVAGISGSKLEWFNGGHMFLIQDKAAWPSIVGFLQE